MGKVLEATGPYPKGPVVELEAVEVALLLEGYGEEGTDQFVDRIKLIQAMGYDERITKIHLLRDEDLGCEVFIRDRTIGGILTDTLPGKRNGEFYLVLSGKIYKMDEWDLVIVKSPQLEHQEAEAHISELAPSDSTTSEMDPVVGIVPSSECTELHFTNGYALCSHTEVVESYNLNVPSLRLE